MCVISWSKKQLGNTDFWKNLLYQNWRKSKLDESKCSLTDCILALLESRIVLISDVHLRSSYDKSRTTPWCHLDLWEKKCELCQRAEQIMKTGQSGSWQTMDGGSLWLLWLQITVNQLKASVCNKLFSLCGVSSKSLYLSWIATPKGREESLPSTPPPLGCIPVPPWSLSKNPIYIINCSNGDSGRHVWADCNWRNSWSCAWLYTWKEVAVWIMNKESLKEKIKPCLLSDLHIPGQSLFEAYWGFYSLF